MAETNLNQSCMERCPKLQTARNVAAEYGVNATVAMREVGVLINSRSCERPRYSMEKHSDAWNCDAPNRYAATFDAVDSLVIGLAANARRARQMTENKVAAYRKAAEGEFTIHRWGAKTSGAVLHEVSFPVGEDPDQTVTDGYRHIGDALGDEIVYLGAVSLEEAQATADQLELSLQG